MDNLGLVPSLGTPKLVGAEPSPPIAVVADLETVDLIDTDGGDQLRDIADELTSQGIAFAISRLNRSEREALRANETYERIGEDMFFPTVEAAVPNLKDDGPQSRRGT
jgi:MFS superfamily sulfate permease-like transporter